MRVGDERTSPISYGVDAGFPVQSHKLLTHAGSIPAPVFTECSVVTTFSLIIKKNHASHQNLVSEFSMAVGEA